MLPRRGVIEGHFTWFGRWVELPASYWYTTLEIVFAQLTKTRHLAARMGGDGVADFHVTIGHQDPINQEFHQGPLLFKRRVS